MFQLHQNSQKRIIEDGYIYFITTNTFKGYPYFKEPVLCELFIEELKLCKDIKKFELYAFCILYDHVHLLLKPGKEFNISKVMKSLKENFSRDANKLIISSHSESDTSTCRLQVRDFLQKNQIKSKNLPPFQWQKSYHDHVIREEKDLENHYYYIINNFEKHHNEGYPESYKYTSENYTDIIDPTTALY